jgi:hypothetical protein
VSVGEISETGNIFSFLRDGDISLIRTMNPHHHKSICSPDRVCEIWTNMSRLCIPYLLDLSFLESTALRSQPTDLVSCESFQAMIALGFIGIINLFGLTTSQLWLSQSGKMRYIGSLDQVWTLRCVT